MDRRPGRGGLGKYLRARGRRGPGRPAEFRERLSVEENDVEEGEEDDDQDEAPKYAKRRIETNEYRYEELESNPEAEQEPEVEVDLSAFVAKQRLSDRNDLLSYKEEYGDDVDYSLSTLPASSLSKSKMRKNKMQTIEWDASMDELKREKEAAEAVRDITTRFRKNQTSFRPFAPQSSPGRIHALAKVEDSRHVYKPAGPGASDCHTVPPSKAEMEEFLDDLLS